jgi:branched-chain amino acid transport system substrate-binding protein
MARFLIIALLIAFFTPLPGGAVEPIKIGMTLGITGKYSEICDMQIKAFKLWEKDINQRGGILGRKVNLVIYDDTGDPQTARDLYEYLITRDKVDLVFAPYSSELTRAILPVTQKYGYPVIASGSAEFRSWQKENKNLFGYFTPSNKYTVGFLEMLTQYGFENVAIAFTEDTFPHNVATGAKEWAERFGLRVIFFSSIGKGPGDIMDIAKNARRLRAQALIVCGYYNDAVNMRLALKKISWYPRAYYASVGPTLPSYARRFGKDANYTFSSSQWEHLGKLPGSRAFYKLFLKTYHVKPSYHSAAAFTAGEILEAAVKKAQALDRAKISHALATMETMTIMGRYGDDRKIGKQTKQFPLIIQIQQGRNEIVWPEHLRTSKPVFRQ